jgi:two-component system, OmpR family, phosphate regulon sensor histidine kinase PhoR
MSQAERLTRLGEILVELSRSPIPTHFFQTLGDEAGSVVPFDYLALCLQDDEKRGYLVHSLSPLTGGAIAARVFELHEGLPGRVIREGRATVVADLMAPDESVLDLEGVLMAAGLITALIVPVRRGFEVLGALLFAGRAPIRYGDEDVQIATLLAAGLSSSLETSMAYQALADERSTLAAVLASTSDAVIMVNQSGVVLLANGAVRPMLGLASDQITGRPLLEVVDYVPLRQLFAAGRPGTSELPLPDGRVAQASMVPVMTPFGEPVGLAAILRDISLLKNLEQMKNEFVNTVSHDLKSPITVIAGLADLMMRSDPGDPRFKTRCEDIRDTADLGKIEAGLDAGREEADLVALIREAARIVGPHAEAKGIALDVQVPREAETMAARSRIRQALVNLLDNAVKYTPTGGRVTLWSAFSAGSQGPETLTIRITDTGIGIPARDLPHVFDKFFRVKTDATQATSGTGLGLAITKSIVEAHGGRIRVESIEGAGTTFVVELPLLKA